MRDVNKKQRCDTFTVTRRRRFCPRRVREQQSELAARVSEKSRFVGAWDWNEDVQRGVKKRVNVSSTSMAGSVSTTEHTIKCLMVRKFAHREGKSNILALLTAWYSFSSLLRPACVLLCVNCFITCQRLFTNRFPCVILCQHLDHQGILWFL